MDDSDEDAPIGRGNDFGIEVMSKDYTPEELARLWIEKEYPVAVAFVQRFEEWLRQNFVKLALNEMNRQVAEPQARPLEPATKF